MKELLRNRVFLLVMASDVLQQVGIWVRNMALLYYVVQQTQGDPVAVSLLTVVEYAPIFLFSLVGGVLADRWRPKRTMIWGDVLSFLHCANFICGGMGILAGGFYCDDDLRDCVAVLPAILGQIA